MNAFSIWVGLGAMVGLWRIAQNAPQRQAGMWVNTGLIILCFSLAGARLSYVLLNWGYFATHLMQAPQVWLGGLTWPGALGGAGLGLIILSFQYRPGRSRAPQVTQILLGWLSDRLYPLLPPLAITTWLGCWQTGIAYGASAPASAFWGVPSLDETGLYSPRCPLQLLAALTLLVYFAILEARMKSSRQAGRLSGLAITGLLINLLAASLLRADPGPYWHGLRADTWLAMGYLALFCAFVLANNLAPRIHRKKPFPQPEQTPSLKRPSRL